LRHEDETVRSVDERDELLDFRRKPIRLPTERYRGMKRVFLTFCCERRRPYFSHATSAEWVLQKSLDRAQAHSSLAHAWCVMPDHMHVFIEGISETRDALRFAHDFKQRTGFEWKSKHKNRLWQPRFYDHIVRSSVATERIVFYIWSNPVRKGMCTNFLEYPYSGSSTMPFKRSANISSWVPPWREEATSKSTPAGLKTGATKT
jgi:putative transposase